jgi:hypothetical protein
LLSFLDLGNLLILGFDFPEIRKNRPAGGQTHLPSGSDTRGRQGIRVVEPEEGRNPQHCQNLAGGVCTPRQRLAKGAENSILNYTALFVCNEHNYMIFCEKIHSEVNFSSHASPKTMWLRDMHFFENEPGMEDSKTSF